MARALGNDLRLRVVKAIDRWLGKLGRKPLLAADFCQPLLAVLAEAYERVDCDLQKPADARHYQAATRLSELVAALRERRLSLCGLSIRRWSEV